MLRSTTSTTLCLLLAAALLPQACAAQDTPASQSNAPAAPGPKDEALLDAVRKSDAAAVRKLLAEGASANARFRYNRSILSFAADRGSAEIVRLLLDAGADPNARDSFYRASCLDWAANKGNAEIIRLLLDKGATGKQQILAALVSDGHTAAVKAVLDSGGLSKTDLSNALAATTDKTPREIKDMLLAAGAEPPAAANYKIPPEDLPRYAGTYQSKTGPELVFVLKEGKLVGGPAGQTLTLAAFDRENFTLEELRVVKLRFKFEGDKVTGLHLTQGAFQADYARVEEKKP